MNNKIIDLKLVFVFVLVIAFFGFMFYLTPIKP
jgi:hypothetical protein